MATISQQLIAGLQSPSMLAPLGKAAQAIGYYPTQRKKEGMLEQIQNAETNAERAKAMIQYGNRFNNDQMTMAGIKLASTASDAKGQQAVASLLKQATDPKLSPTQQQVFIDQAEKMIGNVGLTQGQFNTMLGSARSRRQATINNAATSAASSQDPNARKKLVAQYGTLGGLAYDKAATEQTQRQASQATAQKTIANAVSASDLAAIDLDIARLRQNPTGKNFAALQDLEQKGVNLSNSIVAAGGNADPSKYVGVAAQAVTDYQDRLIKQQDQNEKLRSGSADKQIDSLFSIGVSDTNKNIPVETIIERMKSRKNENGEPYYVLTEKEWAAVEKDINDYREVRAKREKEKIDGAVGQDSLDFIKNNPSFFDNVQNLDEKIKRYTSPNTDSLVRQSIGNELNKLVDAAMKQKRDSNRTETRIDERADVLISNYIRSGDESDPFYNPLYAYTGGFMQGRSRYDVVKFFMTKQDDTEAKRLQQEVANQIRENDSIGYREAVNNALDIIKVDAPGEEGVEARQVYIDEEYKDLVNAIMTQAEKRGQKISEADAYELAVKQINDLQTAEYNAMMQRAADLRQGNRELVYGKSPFVTPPAYDLSE